MGRSPRIPKALSQGPFTLDDARRAGLKRWHIEGQAWRRLGPRTYASANAAQSPLIELEAASLRLPPRAAFSGLTAAWLHGLDVTPCDPIEITVPKSAGISSRAGMAVRRANLAGDEVVWLRGLRATSVPRTLRDVCACLSLMEGVVVCDMAMHLRLLRPGPLNDYVSRSAGARGIAALRKALPYVEPAAESPMETRLRMIVVLAGLPRPEVQFTVRDRWHRFVGRPDLYYPEQKLGLEYDGATHQGTLAQDNRRQNRLLDAGVRLLRFTAGDIFNDPGSVASLVRGALAA